MKKLLLIMLLCAGLAGLTNAAIPEPVGLWLFDEGSGLTTADSGTGGNDGTLEGDAAFVSDPERGGVIEFSGDGWIDIPAFVAEISAANFSISAWFKTSELGMCILSKGNGDGDWTEQERQMYVSDSGTSEGDLDGAVEIVGWGNDWIRGSQEDLNDDLWHHVVITWDYDALEGFVYVDGVEGTYESGYAGEPDNEEDTVRIGFTEGAHSENFVGRIDDVAIFDQLLTAEQVLELFQTGFGPGGLIARNPMPENGAILVEVDTDLSWEAHPDVNEPITFDVYFGSEPNELLTEWYGNNPVALGTTDRTVLNSTLVASLGHPLVDDITYYWRVDTHDPNDGDPILWTGAEWSFTTRPIRVVITADPESVTVPLGEEEVEFTVEAINDETYQWYKSDTIDGEGEPIADTNSLTIYDVQLDDEGYYYCVISNDVPSEATSARARLLTERIMAWYKFENNADDSSATEPPYDAYDAVVSNNTDGTPDVTAAYVTGIDGMAVDLDGIAQYVDVPHQIGPLTSATVSLWVNPDSDTADEDPSLLHDDEYNEGDLHTILLPDAVGYDINGGIEIWVDTEAIVGEWLFVAFVYDTTGEVPVQKMYINGELAVEDESDIVELSMGPLSIGGWWTIDEVTELPIMTRLMDAQFDDVRIYNYPISNLNIASMYNAFADDSACYDADIPLDFDGNCRVDINDFVVMSEEWLLCGLVPECLSEMPL